MNIMHLIADWLQTIKICVAKNKGLNYTLSLTTLKSADFLIQISCLIAKSKYH